jgi:cell division protein FtsW
MNFFSTYFKGDRSIWLIVIFLSLFSILAVYSSTGTLAYKYHSGDTEFYLLRHFRTLIIGFILIYVSHLLKYTVYAKISKIALIITLPLLLLTLLLGTNLNDASRWLTVPGIGLSFQTSDLAKLSLLLYVSRQLSVRQDNIKDFKSAFLPIMLPVIIACAFIIPANFSTAALLFVTNVVLMFIGRINIKYILVMMGMGLVFILLLVGLYFIAPKALPRFETWKNRIENFSGKDVKENYQTEQAKIAIAGGGLTGKGPGNSTQRNFLPHPYSDFIFAIIIEEYGLIGGAFLIFLYLALFFRVIHIARKSPRAFATLLAIGCGFSLVFQAMINMAVAVNLFPVTGQTLPLVSMGGTSIFFTGISIGIILSVSRDLEKEELKLAQAQQKIRPAVA